jgi:lysozyme family protein
MSRPDDLPPSDHYASTDRALLAKEYFWLWSQVKPEGRKYAEAKKAAVVAFENKSRYQDVSNTTNVPWFFIAVIHYREASQSWSGCLHNGDPWNKRTVHVPVGRGPWKSWEDAAVDALQWEGYANLKDWGCGDVFRCLELYNGPGYRVGGIKNFICHKQGRRAGTFDGIYHGSMQDTIPRNASPYVYNGTPYYKKGVSIEDHSFYPDAVDDNVGVMLFLKVLEEVSQELLFPAAPAAIELVSAAAASPELDALDILKNLGAKVLVPDAEITRMFELQVSERPGRLPRFWAVCDFRKRSDEPRFHVLDRIGQTVTSHLCAHGQGSESPAHDGTAVHFSNISGSNESSLGIYRCAETYEGKHGLSLRIDGLEPTDSNGRQRDIVIHSASYVSTTFAAKHGRVGCSNGCFALSDDDAWPIIEQLKSGSLLIAFN